MQLLSFSYVPGKHGSASLRLKRTSIVGRIMPLESAPGPQRFYRGPNHAAQIVSSQCISLSSGS
jgi:hypothetical protein